MEEQKQRQPEAVGLGAVVMEYQGRVIDDETLGRLNRGLASVGIVGEPASDIVVAILDHLDLLILGHLAEMGHPVFGDHEDCD